MCVSINVVFLVLLCCVVSFFWCVCLSINVLS